MLVVRATYTKRPSESRSRVKTERHAAFSGVPLLIACCENPEKLACGKQAKLPARTCQRSRGRGRQGARRERQAPSKTPARSLPLESNSLRSREARRASARRRGPEASCASRGRWLRSPDRGARSRSRPRQACTGRPPPPGARGAELLVLAWAVARRGR